MCMPYKKGEIKMEGTRSKIFLATKGEFVAIYKNKNEFHFAQPITRLNMNLGSIKELDKKKFQIIFPYRVFK